MATDEQRFFEQRKAAAFVKHEMAAKYWVLVAVAKGISLGRVRRMVVATSIDPGLAQRYFTGYGIESCEVSVD